MERQPLTNDLVLEAMEHYARGKKGPYSVDTLKKSLANTFGADFTGEQFDAAFKTVLITNPQFSLDKKDKEIFYYDGTKRTSRKHEGELDMF